MTTYIALLRGINVGGRKKVGMSDLRELFEDLGFSDVRTLLQSGNVVFRSEAKATAGLEDRLEAETAKRLGLPTAFIVRSAGEWNEVVANNPFPLEAKRDPGHLVVQFLKEVPVAGGIETLQESIEGPETLRAEDRHLYIFYPAGIGRSKLTNKLIEDKLGTRGTGRNWNTVLKLAELAQG